MPPNPTTAQTSTFVRGSNNSYDSLQDRSTSQDVSEAAVQRHNRDRRLYPPCLRAFWLPGWPPRRRLVRPAVEARLLGLGSQIPEVSLEVFQMSGVFLVLDAG